MHTGLQVQNKSSSIPVVSGLQDREGQDLDRTGRRGSAAAWAGPGGVSKGLCKVVVTSVALENLYL